MGSQEEYDAFYRTSEFKLRHAIAEIKRTYGVNAHLKNKSLIKFGRNPALGTSRGTIQVYGGNDTYLSSNGITHFSSSDDGDEQDIVVEGHTVDGSGDFTFVVQPATLGGFTKTALTTPLARCTRVYNDDATDFAGDVYVYENGATVTDGVPGSLIHNKVLAGRNQSEKCSTTISKVDYWIITGVSVGVLQKTAATVDGVLEIRNKGKTFRQLLPIPAASGGAPSQISLDPYIIAPANSDVRLTGIASTTNVEVTGIIGGYLAIAE